MPPWWAMLLFGVLGTGIAALGVVLDRRRIRARLLAAGSSDIHIYGPFPAWGAQATMNRRRYHVSYSDRDGHARRSVVHTTRATSESRTRGRSESGKTA